MEGNRKDIQTFQKVSVRFLIGTQMIVWRNTKVSVLTTFVLQGHAFLNERTTVGYSIKPFFVELGLLPTLSILTIFVSDPTFLKFK